MKSIINTFFVGFGFWLILNWVADNPIKVEVLRSNVNNTLSSFYDLVSSEVVPMVNKS
jgi:type IV secretory pathway TrbL component